VDPGCNPSWPGSPADLPPRTTERSQTACSRRSGRHYPAWATMLNRC
jgi:hypothetical protein